MNLAGLLEVADTKGFTPVSGPLNIANFVSVAHGEPFPALAVSYPHLVYFIAVLEMRHWPTFRAFSLSPFRRRPVWRASLGVSNVCWRPFLRVSGSVSGLWFTRFRNCPHHVGHF